MYSEWSSVFLAEINDPAYIKEKEGEREREEERERKAFT